MILWIGLLEKTYNIQTRLFCYSGNSQLNMLEITPLIFVYQLDTIHASAITMRVGWCWRLYASNTAKSFYGSFMMLELHAISVQITYLLYMAWTLAFYCCFLGKKPAKKQAQLFINHTDLGG